MALGNWVTNFNLGARARDVHRGFEDAVDAVWSDVAAALKGAEQPLFITGHSLGGALAIIAAERLRRELKIEATAVYTFGAPRVGSAAFAGSYNACGLGDRSYRLIHGLDIVPTLPPSAARLPACRPDDRLRSRQPLHRRRNAVLVRLRRSAVFRHDQTGIAGAIAGFCDRLVPAVVTQRLARLLAEICADADAHRPSAGTLSPRVRRA